MARSKLERNSVEVTEQHELPGYLPPRRQNTGESSCHLPSSASTVVGTTGPSTDKLPEYPEYTDDDDDDGDKPHVPDQGLNSLLRDATTYTFISKSTAGRPGHKLYPKTPVKLHNNLLAAIGFIEIANAGDFAANMWNENPLPFYAILLMVFGGVLAFSMLYFVIKDAILSSGNIRGLRRERRFLQEWRERNDSRGGSPEISRTINCFLAVNFRELGTELVDRFVMGAILGVGAVLVGTGTLIAIAGDDPTLFVTSNLLTGLVGNFPCALYGLVNLLWAIFVGFRASRHTTATRSLNDRELDKAMKIRARDVSFHSIASGFTAILAGGASMATFDIWFAYLLLFPCLVSAPLINAFFRRRVGYDRPFVRQEFCIDEECLLTGLRHARDRRKEFAKGTLESPTLLRVATSLETAIGFIRDNNLVEEYCQRLLSELDEVYRNKVFRDTGDDMEVVVNLDNLLVDSEEDDTLRKELLSAACKVASENAASCFKYQERWLLEALGCYMAISGDGKQGGGTAACMPSDHKKPARDGDDQPGDIHAQEDSNSKKFVVETTETYIDSLRIKRDGAGSATL
ncbi:hypothetical protein OQA88_977 [Cercophora sp. LCS_1]